MNEILETIADNTRRVQVIRTSLSNLREIVCSLEIQEVEFSYLGENFDELDAALKIMEAVLIDLKSL